MRLFISFENKNFLFKLTILIILFIFGLFFFSTLSVFTAELIWGDIPIFESAAKVRYIQFFSTIGGFLFPGFFYLYFDRQLSILSISQYRKQWFPTLRRLMLLIVIMLSIVLIPFVVGLGELNEMIKLPESWKSISQWMSQSEAENEKILKLLTQPATWKTLLINTLLICLLPAFSEEIFFRGVIQRLTHQLVKNQHVAIILTGAIFSLIHFQFNGFIPRMVLGIYLGYLAAWSGSLILPITAHFLHNFNSLLIDFVAQKRDIDLEKVEPFQAGQTYIFLILLAIPLFIGLRTLYLNRKKENPTTPV